MLHSIRMQQPYHFYRATLCVSAVFAVARCLSVRLSVRPSVRHVGALYPYGWTYSFSARSPIILVFRPPAPIPNFKGTPSAGAQNTRGGKIFRYSTEIAVYLKNGTRYAHGCYGTLIGSRMRSIEWWHFQWPWRTPNPVFKITVFWSQISQNLGTKLL